MDEATYILDDIRFAEMAIDDIVLFPSKDRVKNQRAGFDAYHRLSAAKDRLEAKKANLPPTHISYLVDRITDVVKSLLIYVFETTQEEIHAGLEQYKQEMTSGER